MSMSFDTLLKRHFWAVLLLLLALAAYFQAAGITQVVGSALAVDEKALAASGETGKNTPLPALSSEHSTSADAIIRRNPLDSVRGDLTPPVDNGSSESALPSTDEPYRAPACDGVKVLATAVSNDATWSFAALSGGSSEGTGSKLRRQGDDYAGKRVWFIRWDRVWLIGTGSFCQVEMFAQAGAAPPPPVAASPMPATSGSSGAGRGGVPSIDSDAASKIQKIGPNEYNISRSLIDKLLENQADLFKIARMVPEQENGKTVGLRVYGIRPDTLLGTLGMQSGDRLEKINGFDVTSPEKGLEAYAKLRTADRLTLAVNRGGQPTNLDFHIK